MTKKVKTLERCFIYQSEASSTSAIYSTNCDFISFAKIEQIFVEFEVAGAIGRDRAEIVDSRHRVHLLVKHSNNVMVSPS